VHGATGLVSSDVVYEYGKSDHLFVPGDMKRINENFSALAKKAIESLRSAGFENNGITVMRSLDMRYRHQVHELNVPLAAGLAALSEEAMEEAYGRFDELYEQTYGPGAGYREAGKEIMAFRVVATGQLKRPTLKSYPLGNQASDPGLKGRRDVYFEEYNGFVSTPIYDYSRLAPGCEILGPAVIETPITTIVINPRDRAVVDKFLNVRIYVGD
jgi:N-methylhydantoinase A